MGLYFRPPARGHVHLLPGPGPGGKHGSPAPGVTWGPSEQARPAVAAVETRRTGDVNTSRIRVSLQLALATQQPNHEAGTVATAESTGRGCL